MCVDPIPSSIRVYKMVKIVYHCTLVGLGYIYLLYCIHYFWWNIMTHCTTKRSLRCCIIFFDTILTWWVGIVRLYVGVPYFIILYQILWSIKRFDYSLTRKHGIAIFTTATRTNNRIFIHTTGSAILKRIWIAYMDRYNAINTVKDSFIILWLEFRLSLYC